MLHVFLILAMHATGPSHLTLHLSTLTILDEEYRLLLCSPLCNLLHPLVHSSLSLSYIQTFFLVIFMFVSSKLIP